MSKDTENNTYLLQRDNDVLCEALRKCRDQFLFYTEEHMKAGKFEKAATNKKFADIASKALNTKDHPKQKIEKDNESE